MNIFGRPNVGIDLGTTKVLTFVANKGIVVEEPPIVAVSLKDNKVLAIGDNAKNIMGRVPKGVKIYKPIKSGIIADYKNAEIMLKHFLKKTLGNLFFIKPNLVISRPAEISSTERKTIIDVAKKIGASKVYLESEPILAALGCGIPMKSPKGNLILDIGGGTSDSAVISLGGIVASKSIKYAGSDIDRAIVEYMASRHRLNISEKIAEEIKINKASAINIPDDPTFKVKGKDIQSNLPKTQIIYVNELLPIMRRELNSILEIVKEVFHKIPPELASDIIEKGMILTGGSSQIKGLTEFIKSSIGINAIIQERPEQAVIRGLAVRLKQTKIYDKVLLTKK